MVNYPYEILCYISFISCGNIHIDSPYSFHRTYDPNKRNLYPGFDPWSGQFYRLRFFLGFFLDCKTNIGKMYATSIPEYHRPT